MSKNIFINNLDTYVSQAIYKELRNDQADAETGEPPESYNNIFGTYIGKDSSMKPETPPIKKMLKVSQRALKPKAVTVFEFDDSNNSTCIEIQAQPGQKLHFQVWLDCVRPPRR